MTKALTHGCRYGPKYLFSRTAFFFLSTFFYMQPHASLAESTYFRLTDAIADTLHNDRQVGVLILDVVEQQGVVQEKAAPFDYYVNSEIEHDSIRDAQDISTGVKSTKWAHENRGRIEVAKKTRPGTRILMGSEVLQSHNPVSNLVDSAADGSIAGLFLRIEQPLLKDLLYGRERVDEIAEKWILEAVKSNTLLEISARILETIEFYWDLAASQKIIDIQMDSVKKTEELMRNTDDLIKEDEIPKSDRVQVLALLANENIALEAARQEAITSTQQLFFLTGLGDRITDPVVIDWKLDDFPKIKKIPLGDEQIIQKFISIGIMNRPEILSLKSQLMASKYIVIGDLNALLPSLDIVGEISSSNLQMGRRTRSLSSILSRDQSETDASVMLRFSMPLQQSEARGRLRQQAAESERFNLLLSRSRHKAMVKIREATTQHATLAELVDKAEEEVKYNSELVSNEIIRLNAGASTLFVVLDFQRRLTNSKRELVRLQARYAKNLALLYYEMGILLSSTPCFNEYAVANVEQFVDE
ncbi:TolC family protein [Estrella lausannensis]|uniref:Outer membrane efflux protein n=1 Tax=Estrella lausannensis TaxID=483423 RepID=A0A0H5DQI2_9BACT|nr:TolC family protein [Estrella lausannensis]CRX38338.1 hypothetical protein ELAC_0992 [Estrella lausannensis]